MIDVGWSESTRPTKTRLILAADDVEKIIERDPNGSTGPDRGPTSAARSVIEG